VKVVAPPKRGNHRTVVELQLFEDGEAGAGEAATMRDVKFRSAKEAAAFVAIAKQQHPVYGAARVVPGPPNNNVNSENKISVVLAEVSSAVGLSARSFFGENECYVLVRQRVVGNSNNDIDNSNKDAEIVHRTRTVPYVRNPIWTLHVRVFLLCCSHICKVHLTNFLTYSTCLYFRTAACSFSK